ncbi:hypothetical protein ACRS6B_12805 [Nocardia asteroides]
MFVFGDRVVCTTVDLVRAAHCEFAFLRTLDAELGTIPAEPGDLPPELEPGSGTDDVRQRLLDDYRTRFGGAVAEIDHPADGPSDPRRHVAALTAAHTGTVAALRSGAHVVHNATFFDGRFHCRADFLVRAEHRVRYTVHGIAPTTANRVGAALELAACAQALDRSGALTAPLVRLHLGAENRARALSDLLPLYRARRRRVERIADEKLGELLPVQWGDPRYLACGRCRTCTGALSAARDLLLVAGMPPAARARLREAGVNTIIGWPAPGPRCRACRRAPSPRCAVRRRSNSGGRFRASPRTRCWTRPRSARYPRPHPAISRSPSRAAAALRSPSRSVGRTRCTSRCAGRAVRANPGAPPPQSAAYWSKCSTI